MELIRIRCRDRGGPLTLTIENGAKVVKVATMEPTGTWEMTFSFEELRVMLEDRPANAATQKPDAEEEADS